jgi:iron-sulfur cluster repair protein YtfE (RIC family)
LAAGPQVRRKSATSALADARDVTATQPFASRATAAQEPELDLTSIAVIHRAIRQDLRRLADRLAEITGHVGPPTQARAIGRYATALFAEIRRHHDNEDRILWPVIAATAGQAVDLTPLTDDHRAIEAAIGTASQVLASCDAGVGNPPELCAAVTKLRDMLDEHIADEELQILPAMRRYVPSGTYRRCERQIQRKASLTSRRFTASWLARFAQPDELTRLRAIRRWSERVLLSAARSEYARLERQAFGARLAIDTDTSAITHSDQQ